ncbi:MAG: sugar transferase [Cyanobacteria bacterium P01_F01_bin.150]
MTSQTVSPDSNDSTRSDLRSPLEGPFSSLYEAVRFRRGTSIAFVRGMTLLVLDISMVVLAWWFSQVQASPSVNIRFDYDSCIALLPVVVVMLGVIAAGGLYKPGAQWQDLVGLLQAIALGSGLSSLMLYVYRPAEIASSLTSTQLILFLGSSLFLITSGRIILKFLIRVVRARGAVRHPVFLICDENEQTRALQAVESENHYVVSGITDASALDLKNRDETLKMLKDKGVNEVFVSWDAIRRRLFLCWHFQKSGITLQILPASLEPLFWQPEVWMLGGIPTLKFAPPLFAGINFWLKRYVDFFGALIIFALLSPVYALIAIAIRLDSPGPIFYKQTRVGLHGQEFKAWKFRSMVVNADALQKELEAKNETADGILFKMKDDPRITRVGKFLRQYSLDELPQIFNVLFGEMSLVGPRPLPLRDVEKFAESHFIRHEVLPGITGLWQVSGRSDVMDFNKVIRLDLMYIENWSLWLDFKILLRTIEVVLKKTGAY